MRRAGERAGSTGATLAPHLSRGDSRSHYAPGTQFAMDTVTMIGNTGTYLDSPSHRFEGGPDLAGLDLATLVDLRAEVFDVRNSAARGVPAAAYSHGAPYLTTGATRYLVEQGALLVGVDSLNVDDTETDGERPAHSGLLAAGIHVVEHPTNLGA